MTCPFAIPSSAVHSERARLGGVQHSFTFPNGWGASVVQHRHSYGSEEGLWELAVIGKDGDLNYAHPVSRGDVRGSLSVADVDALLAEIAATTDATPMRGADDKVELGNGGDVIDYFARCLSMFADPDTTRPNPTA